MLDARAFQVVVAVDDLDETGSALVRHAADRADRREMLRIGRDPEKLPRLEVDTDLDRKARIPVEPLVRRHQPKLYSPFARLSIAGSSPRAAW